MEISENTISILKNFASINNGILITADSKILKTKSVANNIFAKAVVSERFPVDIAIYDLNEFLNVISLFNEPNFNFNDEYVEITDKKNKRTKLRYRYASKDLIVYPEKDIDLKDFDVKFKLSKESINSFNKASSMMLMEDISLTNQEEDGVVTLKVLNTKDSSSNVFSIDVGETDVKEEFDFHLKAENLKLISGDYNVGLSSKLISRFDNNDMKIQYYIAIEASSSYNS